METRLMTIGDEPASDPAVLWAAALLESGQVVALPTETVYGLAGNAADCAAVARIFAAKNRPADNPLIVHLAGYHQLNTVAKNIPPEARALANAFWPGPLTLILEARPLFRKSVCRGLDTIAVRVPDHPVFAAVIQAAGIPLAAPSANLSGHPSPTTAAHVLHDMHNRIPLILDGGPCRFGIESTVLDLSRDEPAVLRPGLVTRDALVDVLGAEVTAFDLEAAKRSPGTRYRHYSPRANVYLLGPDISEEACSRLWQRLAELSHRIPGYLGARAFGTAENKIIVPPTQLARRLYHELRTMDARGVTDLIIDGLPDEDPWLPLMDRLKRAADHYLSRDDDIAMLDL